MDLHRECLVAVEKFEQEWKLTARCIAAFLAVAACVSSTARAQNRGSRCDIELKQASDSTRVTSSATTVNGPRNVFVGGKVSKIEIAGSNDAGVINCFTKVLRKMTIAKAKNRLIAIVALEPAGTAPKSGDGDGDKE